MSSATKARIVPIGNSHGVRIPKPLLEQSELGREVELQVQPGQIIIRAASRPRQRWEESFQTMAERGDDLLLDPESTGDSAWDEQEWEW